VREGTRYTLKPYSPYPKVEKAFFSVYALQPQDASPSGFLFVTSYPVLHLGSSILAYRQITQQNVSEYVHTSSLLLRNPDFLVFGASNSCVLITSQHTHQSLSDALSSTL